MKNRIKTVELNNTKDKNWTWILLAVSMIIIVLLRSRVAAMPFERDEGEFAYMGQLILKGLMPYTDGYNMKLPGTYWMYAGIIKIFGSSPTAIHTGVTLTTLMTMAMIFYFLKQVFNSTIALTTAFIFGLMVSAKSTLGFAGHATHFVTLFMVAGLVCWYQWQKSNKILYVLIFGIMMGFSFLMKQQGVFFIIFGGILTLYTLYEKDNFSFLPFIKSGLLYTLGVFIPYLLTILWILTFGDFDKFWFWTVEYATKYTTSVVQLKDAPMMFYLSFSSMWKEFPLVWISAIGGLAVIWKSNWDRNLKIFALLFFIFSFLTICPGMYFRQHYFITWIPSLALLVGIFYDFLAQKIFNSSTDSPKGFILASVFLAVILGYSIKHNKPYWISMPINNVSKDIYGTNPFVESKEIASYIKRNSSPDDKIAILGSEPQILVYADRISATGHIYTYGMMEKQDYNVKMQEEMIREIEKNKPKFIVFVKVGLSWMEYPDSPRKIFEWMPQYIDKNYEMKGQIEVSNEHKGEFYWDEKATNRQPSSENHIVVFKRKDGI